METSPAGTPPQPNGRRWAIWTALALGWALPSVGCQVEYAGMTLPSGKYMHDDVQYFPPGPDFPWANTQAATQRARMQAMGMELPPEPGAGGPLTITPAPGAIPPIQNQMGRPQNINANPPNIGGEIPNAGPAAPPPAGVPAAPAPGVVPPPGAPAPGEAQPDAAGAMPGAQP